MLINPHKAMLHPTCTVSHAPILTCSVSAARTLYDGYSYDNRSSDTNVQTDPTCPEL